MEQLRPNFEKYCYIQKLFLHRRNIQGNEIKTDIAEKLGRQIRLIVLSKIITSDYYFWKFMSYWIIVMWFLWPMKKYLDFHYDAIFISKLFKWPTIETIDGINTSTIAINVSFFVMLDLKIDNFCRLSTI